MVATDPEPDEEVERGSSVVLYVASGRVTVPNVVGKKVNDARKLLEDAGLRVDTDTEPTDEVAPGTVIRQDPLPESSVEVDSRVRLTVAERPAITTTTPPPTTTTDPASPSPTDTTDDSGPGPGEGD